MQIFHTKLKKTADPLLDTIYYAQSKRSTALNPIDSNDYELNIYIAYPVGRNDKISLWRWQLMT